MDDRLDLKGTAGAQVLAGAALIAIGLVFIHYLNGPIWGTAFFDGRVLVRAVEAVRAGHGPYDLIFGLNPDLDHLPLVQPPHIAWLMEALARTPAPVGAITWVLHALIVVGLATGVWFPTRQHFKVSATTLLLCAGVFATFIGGSGMIAILTGNISAVLWGAIVAAAYLGFTRERWNWFHAAVLAATLFKPFYAVLWIVPVMVQGWSWRQVWIGAACFAGAAAAYAAALALRPDLAAGWFAALESRHVVGDIGWGFYALLRDAVGSAPALAVHALYALALLALLRFGTATGSMRWAALIIVAIAANPRMNEYDFAFAAIPAFFIYATRITELVSGVRGVWLALAATVLVGAVSCAVCVWNYHVGNIAILMMMGGAVIGATAWAPLLKWVTRAFRPVATS